MTGLSTLLVRKVFSKCFLAEWMEQLAGESFILLHFDTILNSIGSMMCDIFRVQTTLK